MEEEKLKIEKSKAIKVNGRGEIENREEQGEKNMIIS